MRQAEVITNQWTVDQLLWVTRHDLNADVLISHQDVCMLFAKPVLGFLELRVKGDDNVAKHASGFLSDIRPPDREDGTRRLSPSSPMEDT